MNELYTTHITFISGDSHREDPITADKLASTVQRLTMGPAAMMGIIKRAIIVDSGDCICIEIKDGNVVFPEFLARECAAAKARQKVDKN